MTDTNSSNRPPFETFKNPWCRGSYLLGSACGNCERCTWERNQMEKKGQEMIDAFKPLAELKAIEPLFYLKNKTIYKRPISRREGDKTITTLGFPVCTVSEYLDEKTILDFFIEHAS